jgi:GntR family transcriptional regulator/MocR family aminotransferase
MPVSEQTFYLDADSTDTLQHQIQKMVIEGVLSGRLRPGDKMPSSRRLAEHLGISRITVTLAFTELVSNDYLSSRGRSGYFVSASAPRPVTFKPAVTSPGDSVDWTRVLPARAAEFLGPVRPDNWHEFKYPFIYGQADASLFDHQNWRLCALKALGRRDFSALTSDYYERDDPVLIEFILRHILPRRGISARPEQVLITLGAQNALWLTAQLLLTQRRLAAMENPCYPGIRQVLMQTRCKRRLLDVDGNGLPVEELSSDVDVVFTTPSHHSPTNATMPLSRRQELLRKAHDMDFLIVEDDYEFEISFTRAPSPALKSMDRDGRVIYIGSFSKSLFPGLRLGFIVGSETFVREARALRANVLRHPPGHIQRTAAYFLSLGHYDAQIARIGRAYSERRQVMAKALADHDLVPHSPISQGGSSFWMRAPDGVNSTELAERLRQDQVLIEPGRAFFPPDQDEHGFYRLAYSSIPSNRIAEGIRRLANALR